MRGSVVVAAENPDRAWVSQLRKGLVELLVLGALKRDEMYGYQLLQKLSGLEGLALTESTLYPVLARLTDDRLLAVRQVASPAGPPRRYYRLTAGGERRLGEMVAHWRAVNGSIDRLLGAEEGVLAVTLGEAKGTKMGGNGWEKEATVGQKEGSGGQKVGLGGVPGGVDDPMDGAGKMVAEKLGERVPGEGVGDGKIFQIQGEQR